MYHENSTKIKAFYEVDSMSFSEQLTNKIKKEIETKSKEYILGVDEEEFKNYLTETYTVESLKIDFENEYLGEPKKGKEIVNNWNYDGGKYERETYIFKVIYPFTGSSVLFKVRPSTIAMTTTDIFVDDTSQTVSFTFTLYDQDPLEFNKRKAEYHKMAFSNCANVNQLAEAWNRNLRQLVNNLFDSQKAKFLKENNFFAAINIKVNKNTASVFTPPIITKKLIPQPTISKTKEFSTEPTMSKEMFNDILKVIYDSGKNMEKKPALYLGKDEEGLRDQFLFVLETRYDGTTATGETFNRGGKTDIILKYANDGSNLFVAECKFWHGGSEFLKAISQLFDRYLTWRDSKAALLIFVKNNDFTNVINTIKVEIVKHPYFKSASGQRGETSFSYIFHLPQDKDKSVLFEVIAFHYDK